MLRLFKFSLIIFFSVCLYAQTDPNTDPNWDWINGDYPNAPFPSSQYRMYIEFDGIIQAVPRDAPWGQGNAWIGLQDMKREDGWVLVSRDFGTPYRSVWSLDVEKSPYFILYNKFKGILRFFILVRSNQDLTSGAIELKFNNDNAFKTATLTYLKPRAYATDKLANVQNNAGLALSQNMNDNWAWADYPMAYDPTFVGTEIGAWLDFQLIGTIESQINIAGTGTGINGTQKEVRDFMTGTNNGAVTLTTDAPAVNTTKSFSQFTTSVFGTASSWDKWKQTVIDFNKKLPIMDTPSPISVANNNLKLFLNNIEDNWLFKGIPFIGAAVGLVDFLAGGGQKTEQTVKPTFTGMNFSLTGSITTSVKLPNPKRIQVPSSKLNPNIAVFGSNTPIVYNSNIGVLNLTSTPVVKYKTYFQPYGNGQSRQYVDCQVQDNLNVAINPASGLTLDSILAYIVMDPSKNVVNLQNPTADPDLNLLATWTTGTNPKLALESSLEGRFIFRSNMVPYYLFKYQRIQGPIGNYTPDITIKIKAVLHRSDDPSAQPVLIVLTYEPELESAGTGNWPAVPSIYNINIANVFELNEPIIYPTQYCFSGDQITISAPQSIGNYIFSSWTDGVTNRTRIETPTANTTFTAFYKYPNHSSNSMGYNKDGQRKFVRGTGSNDAGLWKVYESAGYIWLEKNGVVMNGGAPVNSLSDGPEAKSPSIDYVTNYTTTTNIFVVYQQKTATGKYKIKLAKFDGNGQKVYSYDILTSSVDYALFDATPIIAITSHPNLANGKPKFTLVWRQKAEGPYQDGLYFYPGVDNGTTVSWYYLPPQKFSLTDAQSYNPTIAVFKSPGGVGSFLYHVAWQQGTTKIKYRALIDNWNGSASGGIVETGNLEEPSYGAGETINVSPSIALVNTGTGSNFGSFFYDSPKLVWQGDFMVVHRGKSNSSSSGQWNTFYMYYANDEITAANINAATEEPTYVIAWSELVGYNNRYIKSTNLGSQIQMTNVRGKDLQVANYLAFWEGVNINVFNNYEFFTAPYSFQLYEINEGLGKQTNSIAKEGRFGTVLKNESEFYFGVGDVTINNSLINFVPIIDSIYITDNEALNSRLLTEPFLVTDNSNLTYSVIYGVKDSLIATQNLSNSENILFKVELIDNTTGEVLGKFDEVTQSNTKLISYENISYQINTNGIGNRTVRLRLTINENLESATFSLSKIYSDGASLSKSKFKEINWNKNLVVNDYALEQNYPNPFNPRTRISWQSPVGSHQTLKVYDILGNEVATLVDEYREAGRYEINFDASNLASGVYIYKIQAGEFVSSKKMILLK